MAKVAPGKTKARSDPRISVNKLAEYLTASPAQRRRIVTEQKYPPEYKTSWYREASAAIVKFLCDDQRDEDTIVRLIDKLHATSPSSDTEHVRLKTNADALEAFLGSWAELDLGLGSPEAGAKDPRKLSIGGVDVSVRPEVLIRSEKAGRVGAVKLYLSKDKPLVTSSAQYVATLVERFLTDIEGLDTSRGHCQVFDVFGGLIQSVPSSTKNRLRDIEAACQEIALLWTTV